MKIDKWLFFSFIGLTIFGLIMMSSMSVSDSYALTDGGDNSFYFKRHFFYILIGIPLFLSALKFPYESLKKNSVLLFLLSIILLIFTLVKGENFGTAARSWIRLFGFSFQPVELVKLTTIIFLSAIFSSGKNNPNSLIGGFLPFSIALGIPAILIVAQPDFGSLFVLIIIVSCIYFVAGASLKHFFGGFGIFLVGATIIVLSKSYILHRIKVFLDPSLDPLNTGFQVKQALIAIGSGGPWGLGFQNSIQRFDYLPEVQSDTIFAAIAEEMGFFRILILVGIYLFIIYRGLFIAKNAPDEFSKLLAIGITVWISGQAFINIAVNLALLPNTGITLPLISYGGSSMIVTFIGFGILLNISNNLREVKKKYYL